MDALFEKLTGEQALAIVLRLASREGAVAEAVLAVAREVLVAVDLEEVSKTEFKDWCVDIPVQYAASLLEDWRKRTTFEFAG